MKLAIYVIFILLTQFAFAENSPICNSKSIEEIPVLSDGRYKPFITFSKELLKHQWKIEGCSHLSDSNIVCHILNNNLEQLQSENNCHLKWKIRHPEILNELKKQGIVNQINQFENIESTLKFQLSLAQNSQSTAIKELETLIQSFDLWKNRLQENDKLIAFTDLSTPLQNKIKIEYYYEKLNLLHLAMWIVLLSFLLSIFNKFPKVFYALGMLALFLQMGHLILRVLITERAPVTNMYETVLWSSIGVLLISFLLILKFKNSLLLQLGLFFNLILLFILKFLPDSFDSTLRPLMPVLRDNIWLSTHVTTITLSYSFFVISWLLANFQIFKEIFKQAQLNLRISIQEMIRYSIQLGSVFLAIGIILGGIWADYSWGRFWGWDPKETWSLIVLVVYMIVLHSKYTGWLKNKYYFAAVAIAFLFVIMAWFGVNYILATGLHSYGFSQGGSLAIYSLMGAQFFLVVYYLKLVKN